MNTEQRLNTNPATFIVAYLYFRLIDNDYMGWKRGASYDTRCDQVKIHRSDAYKWLKRVKKCSPEHLENNDLGLSYDDVMRMTDTILANWDEDF